MYKLIYLKEDYKGFQPCFTLPRIYVAWGGGQGDYQRGVFRNMSKGGLHFFLSRRGGGQHLLGSKNSLRIQNFQRTWGCKCPKAQIPTHCMVCYHVVLVCNMWGWAVWTIVWGLMYEENKTALFQDATKLPDSFLLKYFCWYVWLYFIYLGVLLS